MNWQAALDYVACLNANNYLGHNDWRLPNVNELYSLVDHSTLPTLPSGHPFTNVVQSGFYWSSTTYAGYTHHARSVGMWLGYVNYLYKSHGYDVWPVRGGQCGSFGPSVICLPKTGQTTCYDSSGAVISCAGTGQDGAIQAGAAWPDPRFTDNGDQTITDKLTGLVWTKDAGTPTVGSCTGGVMNWQSGLDYVACLNTNNYLGHNDWRLPNVNELKSLVDHSTYFPTLPSGHPFTNVVQSGFYWSSTTSALDTGGAWVVGMWGGGVTHGDKTTNYHFYVWPVRGGTVTAQSDSTPPTGTITINSGATYTNTTSVTLTLTCTDAGSGCSQMRFSNNNPTWSAWESYTTSKAWTLTSGDGTKTVYVQFKDVAGNISNSYSDTIILQTSRPDLRVSSLTAPATAGAGTTINITDTTRNNGPGAAGASTTRFYLSTDPILDVGDTLLGSRAVPALAAGASSTGTTSVTIPGGTAGGIYYIIARADDLNVVAETNENNNTRWRIITISP